MNATYRPCCDENGFVEVAIHRTDLRTYKRVAVVEICCCDCRRGQDRQQALAADREKKGSAAAKPQSTRVPMLAEHTNALLNQSTVLAVYPRPTWYQRQGLTEEPILDPKAKERSARWLNGVLKQRDPLPETTR